MEHIANRIGRLRKAAGLTETQLAAESAIPRMTFKRRMIDPGTFTLAELARVARVLGTTPTALSDEDAA